ncbi:hypothetical protein ACH46_13445 [Gordonia phthalatica]|uniref:GIY-YIG domain-containing protein n=1 Tax=Gordonia phthalatica TaxID=1136941 RepID=A0A0N7FUU0_9ACTN|nr:hypothetical protein ACH46_13445 [Gordonia phthalatica]
MRTGDLAARSWKYFALPTGAALKFEWVRPTDGADWELGTSGRLGAEITEPFHPEDVFILGLELAPDWVMPDEANGAPTKHSDGEDVAASMLPASAFHPVPEPDADELARRKASLARWLADEGFDGPFPDRDAVRSHLSADGPSAAGHYLLSFSDGQAYIGETIDFVGRFAQHSVTYSDIEAFYIRSDAAAQTLISRNRDSAKRSLRRDERALIHAAQNDGLILRNTMEMANPIKVSRTFSELVSADEIDRWVAQPLSANADDSAVAQRVERQHTAARGQAFNAFINLSEAEQVLRIVRAYLERCVPFPARTEYASWAISCMPKSLRGARGEKERWSVLCCLSIARPETLTITRNKQTGHVSGFVAANEVELGCDEDLGVVRLIRQHPGIRINYEAHASFGPGVVLLHAPDLDALEDLLDDTRVTRAASTVALRMCRVGPSTQRAVHNPYLVERAMGWERE